MMDNDFKNNLQILLNKHSMENGSDTPDFILANYLKGCLENFDNAVKRREQWYGIQNLIKESQDQ